MFDQKTLDDLTVRLTSLIPEGALELRRDMEKNIRAMLSSAFSHLDLITREEFEVQKALLERALDRLAALEQQLKTHNH